MYHIGFTGSSTPITNAQRNTLEFVFTAHDMLRDRTPDDITLHHGDCINADCEAHTLARSLNYNIVLHPPIYKSKRAFCTADIELPPRPYLDRNRHIIAAADELIAVPKEYEEELRSGTWATVRYARRKGIPITLIYPDGSIGHE